MEQTAPNTDKHYCLNAQTDIGDHQAAGSNPVTRTKRKRPLCGSFFFWYHGAEGSNLRAGAEKRNGNNYMKKWRDLRNAGSTRQHPNPVIRSNIKRVHKDKKVDAMSACFCLHIFLYMSFFLIAPQSVIMLLI